MTLGFGSVLHPVNFLSLQSFQLWVWGACFLLLARVVPDHNGCTWYHVNYSRPTEPLLRSKSEILRFKHSSFEVIKIRGLTVWP